MGLFGTKGTINGTHGIGRGNAANEEGLLLQYWTTETDNNESMILWYIPLGFRSCYPSLSEDYSIPHQSKVTGKTFHTVTT